jgi:hypothetical protein
VRLLVAGDLRQARVGICWEAGGGEVALGELGQALAVEGCFEVFEGEGVVEDFDWVGLLGLTVSC